MYFDTRLNRTWKLHVITMKADIMSTFVFYIQAVVCIIDHHQRLDSILSSHRPEQRPVTSAGSNQQSLSTLRINFHREGEEEDTKTEQQQTLRTDVEMLEHLRDGRRKILREKQREGAPETTGRRLVQSVCVCDELGCVCLARADRPGPLSHCYHGNPEVG